MDKEKKKTETKTVNRKKLKKLRGLPKEGLLFHDQEKKILALPKNTEIIPQQNLDETSDRYFTHKIFLLVVVGILLLFTQTQIEAVSALADGTSSSLSGQSTAIIASIGENDLSSVDVTQIQSTAQGIAALFPLDQISTMEDAIAVMIPTGTPSYGEAMGVNYDDPVGALQKLQQGYPALKQLAKQDEEVWQRYLSIAAAPRGISCEFCCGVGPQGVDSSGNLRCGCSHNPAVQSVTLWLLLNTDYSDAEILREVYRWKSLWFPKDMIGLALQIAGGDTSVLQNLPGMVGGC